MRRLEWAFAGTSHITIPPPTDTNDHLVPHCTWTHWIDSHHNGPVTDEGDIYPQADDIHTLELGQMVNPATGVMTRYEENWLDLDVATTGEACMRCCIVLMIDDVEHGVTGMVARVGQFCQGIIKVRVGGGEGEVAVERWMCEEDVEVGKGIWKRVARLGRLFLPCALTFEPGRIEEGSLVQYGDFRWEVRELYEW